MLKACGVCQPRCTPYPLCFDLPFSSLCYSSATEGDKKKTGLMFAKTSIQNAVGMVDIVAQGFNPEECEFECEFKCELMFVKIKMP